MAITILPKSLCCHICFVPFPFLTVPFYSVKGLLFSSYRTPFNLIKESFLPLKRTPFYIKDKSSIRKNSKKYVSPYIG